MRHSGIGCSADFQFNVIPVNVPASGADADARSPAQAKEQFTNIDRAVTLTVPLVQQQFIKLEMVYTWGGNVNRQLGGIGANDPQRGATSSA